MVTQGATVRTDGAPMFTSGSAKDLIHKSTPGSAAKVSVP
jgi:hypothetical protein